MIAWHRQAITHHDPIGRVRAAKRAVDPKGVLNRRARATSGRVRRKLNVGDDFRAIIMKLLTTTIGSFPKPPYVAIRDWFQSDYKVDYDARYFLNRDVETGLTP